MIDPITGPFDRLGDSPEVMVTLIECWACDGVGTTCKEDACFLPPLPKSQVRQRTDDCLDTHFCPLCKGSGMTRGEEYAQ